MNPPRPAAIVAACVLALSGVVTAAHGKDHKDRDRHEEDRRHDSGTSRTTKGALVGGAIGAMAGDGLSGALKGAAIGGGVAAVTQDGRRGERSREGAVKGAVAGAVVGGVAGRGMDDALRGAAWGAAGGAIINSK